MVVFALAERIFRDPSVLGNPNAEPVAHTESILFDNLHAFGNHYVFQSKTLHKSTLTDAFQAFGQRDGFEGIAILKSTILNGFQFF